MKNLLKSFFILLFVLSSFVYIQPSLAQTPKPVSVTEIERSESEPIAKNCPDSGDRHLISICGNVRQAIPAEQILAGGDTAPHVSQVPVQGVSVYLYECDNSSPTCKRDGLLVHPFSSTSTNKDGNFHLVARKTENSWQMETEEFDPKTNKVKTVSTTIINQSKKRYLVFRCGFAFQGIHVIPSYIDLVNIVHEVNCQKSPYTFYIPPLMQFDFIGGVKLAGNMGVSDPYYPKQIQQDGTELNVAQQAFYEQYAGKTPVSSYVELDGADPRFTSPEQDPPQTKEYGAKKAALNSALKKGIFTSLDDFVPTMGAYWSLDCVEKYKGTKWEALCANKDPKENTKIKTYEKNLYESSSYTIQHLLPNIPPKYSILYYRPLEIRQEISAYYQDQDDLAKFMGLEFANCVGTTSKRAWLTDYIKEKEFPDCDDLKKCNKTLNQSGWINSLTTGGPAQGLASPAQYKKLIEEIDTEIPVCLIEGNDVPVKLGEIQQPGESCQSFHKLCEDGSYWNNYFVTNLGQNNLSTKWGLGNENTEDSYFSSDTNERIYRAGSEGDGSPVKEGASAIASSEREGIQSGWHVIIGQDSSAQENLTEFIAQPFKDADIKKQISDGSNYLVSTRPVAWGQFSDINDEEQMIVATAEDDKDVFDNYAMDMEMGYPKANDNHYPIDDLSGSSDPKKGIEGGTRTPTQGLYLTTASWNRVKALKSGGAFNFNDKQLQNFDSLDSAISVATGHGYINWAWAEEIERDNMHFITFINNIFDKILDILTNSVDKKDNKSFADRTPSDILEAPNSIDSLVATGFEVNEENFKKLFPLPCVKDGLDTCDWGLDQKCYPWNKLDLNESCGTYKDEPTCRDDSPNDGVSRTCRVDTCHRIGTTKECSCIRTWDPANQSYNYTIGSCGAPTSIRDIGYCASVEERLKCAQEQTTCYKEDNLDETNACLDKIYGNSFSYYDDSCNEGSFAAYPNSNTAPATQTTFRPACVMSRAGPNVCDGDVERTSSLKVSSQATDEIDSIDKVNADAVPEAGLELYKSFRDPYTTELSPKPAAWVSVQSSISNVEPDLSQRKDVVGIGTGTSFMTRAQFGQPQVFGGGEDFEPLYIHCKNNDLETTGGWKYGDIEYIVDLGNGTAEIRTESYTDCLNKCAAKCHWECDDVDGTCDPKCFSSCNDPCKTDCREQFLGDGKECQFEDVPNPEVLEIETLEAALADMDNQCISDFSESCQREFLGFDLKDSKVSNYEKYGGLSDTFKLIMNLAGSTFNLEPAAIMTYMKRIMNNADVDYSYYWSVEGEEDLKKASLPWYGGFDFCDDLEPVAQHPYDWLLVWFSGEVTGGAGSALDALAPGRYKTASRCNFLDSTYVTSLAIGRFVPDQCNIQEWGGGRDSDGNYIEGSITYAINKLLFGGDPKGVYNIDEKIQDYKGVWDKCR